MSGPGVSSRSSYAYSVILPVARLRDNDTPCFFLWQVGKSCDGKGDRSVNFT